jgi:hypothetical protein
MNLDTLTSGIVFANAMLFIGIGLVIMAGVVVTINNIFHRYWKPVTFFWPINEHQLTTIEEYKHEHSKQSRRPKKDPVSTAGNQQ